MNQVFSTSDYSQFRRLIGNRPVDEAHVLSIINSIQKNGLMDTIIFCTKDLEIVDGQHRYEAMKRLSLPITYCVLENADIASCIAMNATQAAWSVDDYIGSFAERGYQAYVRFEMLREAFPALTTNVFLSVLGTFAPVRKGLKKSQLSVKTGEMFYPFDKEQALLEELEFLSKFSFMRKTKKHGRADIFYKAIAACYECKLIDNDKLLSRMTELSEEMPIYNNFKECLEAIQDIYNKRNRNRIYLAHEVQKMLDEMGRGGSND